MADSICKTGKVEKVTKETIYVAVVQSAACAACQARSACHSAEGKEKIIEVPNVYEAIQEGDAVKISMLSSKGLKAVVYAFILPILLLFTTLVIFFNLLRNEALAALAALAVTALYYVALYGLRGKIQEEFRFELEKL